MANRTHLVVMPGDGIGPEIMAATLHVVREVDKLLFPLLPTAVLFADPRDLGP